MAEGGASIPSRLVGRALELGELTGELRRSQRHAFRCVVLDGEPGIGKTRLAAELVRRHRGRALTLQARGYPFGAVSSFGLWAEAFESHLRDLPAGEVAAACGDALDDLATLLRSAAAAGGRPGPDPPSAVRLREALAVLLRSLARARPVVVVLDDLHLADTSSWETLDYVAHNLADARVLVVGCVRPGELHGLSAATQVLFRLEQEGVLRRIGVGPLGPADLRDLAEDVLGRSSVPSALVRWLDQRSGGNALFAVGLLDALAGSGQDLSAPSLEAVPGPLRERLVARFARLPSEAVEVLDVLAVVSRRVGLDDLRRFLQHPPEPASESEPASEPASEPKPEALAEVLGLLVETRLVDEQEHGTGVDYEIAHPLMQETLYERLGGARRRALHSRVGRTLLTMERLGEAAPHLARSADVGDDEAIGALARAAQQAWARSAFAESFLVVQSMLELIPSGDERWLDVLDVLSPGGEWLFYEHKEDLDTALGARIMREMQRILEGSSDAARLAALNLYLSVFLGWGSGDLDEARQRGHDAVTLFRQAGDVELARLAAHELSWVYGVDGDFAAQERAARELLAEAEAADDSAAAVMALLSLALTRWPGGDFATTESSYQRAIELSAASENPVKVVYGHALLALARAFGGRLTEASASLAAARAADPAGTEPLVTEVGLVLSLYSGDNAGTLAEARQAAAARGPGQSWVMLTGANAAIEAGRIDDARSFLGALAEVIGDRRFWMMRLPFRWVSALLAWCEGDLTRAVAELDAVASDLVAIDAVTVAAPVLVDLAEASAQGAQPDVLFATATRLRQIAERVDRPHHHALAAVAAGWAALDVGAASEAAARAREAAAQFATSGHRMHEARSLDLLGRSLAPTDRDGAAEVLGQAVSLYDACSAGWRRGRASEALAALGRQGRRALTALDGPGPLTARERQVAALAVEGLTAREIGKQLYIGERTVETHLANIYAKLGVRSRVELLRHAARLPL